MTPINTVSYTAIIDRILRDFGIDDMSIVLDSVVWIGDCLDQMQLYPAMAEQIKPIEVVNYRGRIPSNLNLINFLCYNNQPLRVNNTSFRYNDMFCDGCGITMNQSSYSQSIRVSNTRLNSPYADFTSSDPTPEIVGVGQIVKCIENNNTGGVSGHLYKRLNTPLASTMLNLIDYTTADWYDDTANLNTLTNTLQVVDGQFDTSEEWYKIVNPDWFSFSFESGTVHISYEGYPLDINGFPEVPDQVDAKIAIEWNIMGHLILRGYQHPAGLTYPYCDSKFEFHKRRAVAASIYPDIPQMENIKTMWLRISQDTNQFNSFFQHLHRSDGFINH